jgi:hypothetical protein
MKTYGIDEENLHHSWPRQQMKVSGKLHAPPLHLRGKNSVANGLEVGWDLDPVFLCGGEREEESWGGVVTDTTVLEGV